jgi:hypothetical protein
VDGELAGVESGLSPAGTMGEPGIVVPGIVVPVLGEVWALAGITAVIAAAIASAANEVLFIW